MISRSCESCMLDPVCGFCYRENGTTVFDSSCVPTGQDSTSHAAWGRSDDGRLASPYQQDTTGRSRLFYFFLFQMLEPDRRDTRPNLGLQLLSHVLLLARPDGTHPLPRLLRSRSDTTRKEKSHYSSGTGGHLQPRLPSFPLRYGHHAMDGELGDIPAVGPQHRQRLLVRSQLDLQCARVTDLFARRPVSDLSG